MELNNNNDGANEARTRNYKLSCVCKFKGVRGNLMVICTACGENVHSSSSCSKILNHNNSNNYIKKKILTMLTLMIVLNTYVLRVK